MTREDNHLTFFAMCEPKMMKKFLSNLTTKNETLSNVRSVYYLLRGSPTVKKDRGIDTYLHHIGWLKSRYLKSSIDRKGRPLPWLTYPMIHFLDGRITRNMKVFEFGSGNSTLWWCERVSEVVSCEHDRCWYEQLQTKLPENCDYIFHELVPDGEYSRSICDYPTQFDIVVIDGRDRVNCAKHALNCLTDQGVIIWDNTDRERYQLGFDLLQSHGFRQIEFAGLSPINTFIEHTSVFYRQHNLFGI